MSPPHHQHEPLHDACILRFPVADIPAHQIVRAMGEPEDCYRPVDLHAEWPQREPVAEPDPSEWRWLLIGGASALLWVAIFLVARSFG